jgi:hypothetical protein
MHEKDFQMNRQKMMAAASFLETAAAAASFLGTQGLLGLYHVQGPPQVVNFLSFSGDLLLLQDHHLPLHPNDLLQQEVSAEVVVFSLEFLFEIMKVAVKLVHG